MVFIQIAFLVAIMAFGALKALDGEPYVGWFFIGGGLFWLLAVVSGTPIMGQEHWPTPGGSI